MSEIKPVAWFTEDHLTDRSATTYDTEVVERRQHKGWPVSGLVLHSDHEAEMGRLRAMAQEQGVKDGNEISRLRAEVEEYRKDAVRWRFIASASGSVTLKIHNTRADGRNAAIDAAMGGH